MARKYRNAACIIAPVILDSHVVVSADSAYKRQLRSVIAWGMSARGILVFIHIVSAQLQFLSLSDLCECIGDSIWKLRDGPVGEYVPDFDWRIVRDNMGSSQLYDHLVPSQDGAGDEVPSHHTHGTLSIMQAVCDVLDIKQDDVSKEVPLTSYGLDSLSAAALSFSLRPLLSVSQIQLLSDMTVQNIEDRAVAGNELTTTASPAKSQWSRLQAAESLVSVLAHLTSDIPNRSKLERECNHRGAVAVTGTTGSLGAHVLAAVLKDGLRRAVYALVQSHGDSSQSTAFRRQRSVFQSHGLDHSLLNSTDLTIVSCCFDEDRLGISQETYTNVSEVSPSYSRLTFLVYRCALPSHTSFIWVSPSHPHL